METKIEIKEQVKRLKRAKAELNAILNEFSWYIDSLKEYRHYEELAKVGKEESRADHLRTEISETIWKLDKENAYDNPFENDYKPDRWCDGVVDKWLAFERRFDKGLLN